MANNNVRVEIPANADDLIKLAEEIDRKHQEMGDNSPFRNLNLAEMSQKTTIAKTRQKEGQTHQKMAENAYQERNLALGTAPGQTTATAGTLRFYITSVRDVLLGMHKGNEKKLGEWGFSVLHGAKGKKESVTPE